MSRRPEIGNVQLYPDRPLRRSDKNGYVLKFYCPLRQKRVRKNCGTRDRREARRIMRECRERLINGQYALSDGAITAKLELAIPVLVRQSVVEESGASMTWDEAYDLYRENRSTRVRPKTLIDALSRVQMAERIFLAQKEEAGLGGGLLLKDVMTLSQMEYLQDRLLAGDEGRFEYRSPNTVNSTVGAVMAFVNFCHRRGWIESSPLVQKLDADDAMRGRPISADEFERMLEATPKVVGEDVAASWKFTLRLIWESGFRIGDVMDFSWLDERHIRPVWPNVSTVHPTVSIPSTQKNGRTQVVPMLTGLRELLESVPEADRSGWIANPDPIRRIVRNGNQPTRPSRDDLRMLAKQYSNRAIGRAFGVWDVTIANWLSQAGFVRKKPFGSRTDEVPADLVDSVRSRGLNAGRRSPDSSTRLSKDRVSRVICKIGENAGVIVVQEDPRRDKRQKYASAHDIRRGFANRLINAGVSAETLRVVMRHASFATTEKHYGAIRSATAAAEEVQQKLSTPTQSNLTFGFVDRCSIQLS